MCTLGVGCGWSVHSGGVQRGGRGGAPSSPCAWGVQCACLPTQAPRARSVLQQGTPACSNICAVCVCVWLIAPVYWAPCVRGPARTVRRSARASRARPCAVARSIALRPHSCSCGSSSSSSSSRLFVAHHKCRRRPGRVAVRCAQHDRQVVLPERRRGALEGAVGGRARHGVEGAVDVCVLRGDARSNLCVLALPFLFSPLGGGSAFFPVCAGLFPLFSTLPPHPGFSSVGTSFYFPRSILHDFLT